MWLLVLLSAGLCACRRGYASAWREEVLLLAPIAVVLTLVSSQTGFNHHLRYVLPIFPFAFIWASKVAQVFGPAPEGPQMYPAHSVRRSPAARGACRVLSAGAVGIAAAWFVASSLWVYPHSLSYFNELAGGPMNGHTHLLDSNIDWGQDLLFLKRWLEGHPEAQPIGLAYSPPAWLFDPKDVGIDYTLPPPGIFGPQPGWYAICVRELRERDGRYAYFLRFKPVATAGYSIYIYHLTADSITDAIQKGEKAK
jgi:hypothetical protein